MDRHTDFGNVADFDYNIR